MGDLVVRAPVIVSSADAHDVTGSAPPRPVVIAPGAVAALDVRYADAQAHKPPWITAVEQRPVDRVTAVVHHDRRIAGAVPTVADARVRCGTVSPAGRVIPIVILIGYFFHRLVDVLPVVDEEVLALPAGKPASRWLLGCLGRRFHGRLKRHLRNPEPRVLGDGPGVVRLRRLVGRRLHDHRHQIN